MRLRTKSVPILLKIPNALAKILTKTPSEVAGEDGIDSDIDFKKREQIVIFRGEKLRKNQVRCQVSQKLINLEVLIKQEGGVTSDPHDSFIGSRIWLEFN